MRILNMTATFGKLEQAELAFEPGLNVVEAPNEWGKSTWCAFLLAMLYGLDTRERSTKTMLADKERYAPWSGAPMAGRMELLHEGRRITIERTSKGRVPMGTFRAYETESGLPVPELTAANCGQVLLGVEQSVFRRAGFIRFQELPISRDEALSRRLHELVTTGDETGETDRLGQQLKELRNKCRYKRAGLLPQAEQQRENLEGKLAELSDLEDHYGKLTERLRQTKDWEAALQNHLAAMAYTKAEEDRKRVEALRTAKDRAEEAVLRLETRCSRMPGKAEAEEKLAALKKLQADQDRLFLELQLQSAPPRMPEGRYPDPEKAVETAGADRESYLARKKKGSVWPLVLLMCLALGLAAGLLIMNDLYPAVGALAVGGMLFLGILWKKQKMRKLSEQYREKYGSLDPDAWLQEAEVYAERLEQWQQEQLAYRKQSLERDARREALETQRQSLCGSQSPEAVAELWQQVIRQREQLAAVRQEYDRLTIHLETMEAMVKSPVPPAREDGLSFSEEETASLLQEAAREGSRLEHRLGQYQGRMEALGDPERLKGELGAVNDRIRKLEETYEALTLALNTLGEAKAELQRRFAPRITKRAKEILTRLTEGRYDRLSLGEDFRLEAGTGEDTTLREAVRRSDGTVDQIYLALRLAVAEVLTEDAPLVLDDALVRFDDKRLKAAMDVLQEMAGKKQVILFTCQNREKRIKEQVL